MNKHDELTGTFVLVHPNLIYDPESRQNQIGIISTAELEYDNVMVSFGKDGQGLFSVDALLVLRKPNDIHFDALRDARHLETADFKNILRVSMLANSIWTKNRRQAMELCRDNPNVLQYGTASLEEELAAPKYLKPMNDSLKGTMVLVHPHLPHDPVNRQNHIGMISHADLSNDDVFVDFEGVHGLYSSDALLVLMPQEDIHQQLADMAYETPFAELKALTQIDLFLRYGGEHKEKMAMEIAKANPVIQRYCLEPLNEKLYKDISKNYGRE